MTLPRAVKYFGLRLGICILVLGGAYLVIFGANLQPKPANATAPQKLAEVRAALDEVYISGNSLAAFKQSGATAFQALDDSRTQFEAATARLQTALKTAPATLTTADKASLQRVIDEAHQASTAYRAANGVLSQVISYDPSSDLGSLDQNDQQLASRAAAAQKGLLKAAHDQTTVVATKSALSVQNQDGPALLVLDHTRALLETTAACFGRLHDQAVTKAATTSQTRQECIAAYPQMRLAAVQNVTGSAWSATYQASAKQTIPPLLQRLDNAIKTTD